MLGDIEGYYLGGTATTPGAFTSLTPARLLDTRTGAGSPVGPAGDLSFDVAGVGGVPASGVSSVVLNLTAVAPAASGYLTAYASGTSRPVVSTLNFAPGRTTPNLATVTLGANGRVTLHNGSSGSTHYVADVFGYYLSGTATAVGAFVPISPRRAIDTRTGTGSPRKALPGGYELFSSLSLPSNASAAVLNVTATGAGRTGFLAAPPQLPLFSGAPTEQPRGSRTSTLSYLPGQSVAGLAVMPLNRGQSAIYNGGGGAVQVIADIVGYTVGPTMAWSAGTKIAMFDVTAVSCSSDSFCVALDNEDKATLYDGTSWGTSVVVLPGLDPQAGSASCVSPTFCVVVDKDIDQVVHATTYNGTTWSTPVTLGSIASHVAQTYVRVSCPTTTFCLAGYDKLRFYNGSSWSTETTVAGMGLISGVSCTSPTFCMIVDDEGHVARWNGASWSAVGSVVAKPTIEGLYGVSCTSPTFCLATAYFHSYAWDGVGWNVHNEVNRSVSQSTRLLDVSCASPTFCVGAGDQANVDEFTGGAWTSIPSIGADVALAVSCPTEHFCVVGDQGHVFVGRA